MDIRYLQELPQFYDKSNKQEAWQKKYSTNLSGEKKLQKASVNTDAIKRILDEKKEKEKQEQIAFKEKRDKLFELRSQDKKAKKRVSAMINRTKGACKSVLDDAKDLSTDKAEPQCDADDYGYESAMSQQIFAKLADTYKHIPDDERLKFKKTKVKDIHDVKSRVMNSIKRQEEEDLIPGRKKRKRNNKGDEKCISDDDPFDIGRLVDAAIEADVQAKRKRLYKHAISSHKNHKQKGTIDDRHKSNVVNVNLTNYKSDQFENFKYSHKDKDKDKEKKQYKDKHVNRENKYEREDGQKSFKICKLNKNNKAPPPMSFQELLKMANQKNYATTIDFNTDRESERPMTAREKEAFGEDQKRKIRRIENKENDKRLHEALEKKSDSKSASTSKSKNVMWS